MIRSSQTFPTDALFSSPSRQVLGRYGLAVLLVCIALGMTLFLRHIEAERPTLFLFFATIIAVNWFGGAGPGLVAVLLSVPAGLYFYSNGSMGGFALHTDTIVLLVLFASCALGGSALSLQQHRADRALKQKAAQLEVTNTALIAEMADRRRAEEALEESRAELAHIARLTTMGELTASIAHEINQPLTAIANSAGACMRWLGANPPNVGEARLSAARIQRDSARAADVVSRVRELVRKTASERGMVDLHSVISDVLELLGGELRLKGVTAEVQLPRDIPPILADKVQLEQLFLNLFLNAADAMVQVRDRPRHILVTGASRDQGLAVRVADSGPGFDGDGENLFEAFFTTKPAGMGLGLAICRSIVEAHNGSIAATRGSPHGAVFTLFLPQDSE